jgi:glutamyl-tRNA synthetase
MSPRVRIAPSPTGYFHVGTARTALHNWLFARQQGGTFVLRIEDTDQARNQPEQVEGIQRALRWLGLDWDEGPVMQSERAGLHADAIGKLLAEGRAYACDCTPEQVAARTPAGAPQGYDGFCRDRGLDAGPGLTVRFRTPDEGETTYDDLVLDRQSMPNRAMVDFAIRKSSGDPLFLLSNTVDDADMTISHVIRGADHLSNTFRYVVLWDALGYGPPPVFAHTPLLLNEQRKKLSKRRDKVAVEDYRDAGYLPEAFRNYLILLGWSPGDDREILTLEQMIAEFQLGDVKSAPAIFDEKKLSSVNADYLRALPPAEFLDRSMAWLRDRVEPLAPLVQERTRTLAEVWSMTDFLYLAEPHIDATAWDRSVAKSPAFATILTHALEGYRMVGWNADAIR